MFESIKRQIISIVLRWAAEVLVDALKEIVITLIQSAFKKLSREFLDFLREKAEKSYQENQRKAEQETEKAEKAEACNDEYSAKRAYGAAEAYREASERAKSDFDELKDRVDEAVEKAAEALCNSIKGIRIEHSEEGSVKITSSPGDDKNEENSPENEKEITLPGFEGKTGKY